MASERELSRCRERIDSLSRSSVDCDSLRFETIRLLRQTIGCDRWCWPLADPETLVTSSGLAEHNFGPSVPRSLQLEYSEDAFAAKHLLARRARPVASLQAETRGDIARSPRWDEVLRPAGIGDVAVLACRDAQGCWGWIDALPSAEIFARWGMLPSVVYPTAVLARSQDGADAARALVQAADGRWVTIEAAALEGEREGEVAVQLRSATAAETFELLCRVYALSPREHDVVSLLVAGLDTRAIAKRMFISPHTVQDHLKSVFAKIGIHSRRELLATLSTASA